MTMDTASSDSATSPAVNPSRFTAFDQFYVDSLIREKQWDELILYLDKFISLNPHDGVVHEHPGLMFTVFEQKVLDLIKNHKFDEAMVFFKTEVAPLLSQHDNIFTPLDLLDHVGRLETCIEKMELPDNNPSYTTDVRTALFDYIFLYFPSSIRHLTENWEKTLHQFIMVYFDNCDVCYRCLACQCVLPASQGLSSMLSHMLIGGEHNHKPCRRLTLYLLKRVNLYQGKNEEHLDFEAFCSDMLNYVNIHQDKDEVYLNFEAFRSKYLLEGQKRMDPETSKYLLGARKRKDPASSNLQNAKSHAASPSLRKQFSQEPHGGSYAKKGQLAVKGVGSHIFSIMKELIKNNIEILELFPPSDSSSLAFAVRDVCHMQQLVIKEMEDTYGKGEDMDIECIMGCARTMQENSFILIPLVGSFPDLYLKAKDLDLSIAKLRLYCFDMSYISHQNSNSEGAGCLT